MTEDTRSGRTVVIGLDSADLRLVERWSRSGDLPCLAELLRTCPLVRLTTPSRALQGSVWSSILTGAGPGRHGLYLYTQLQPNTYKLVRRYADHAGLTPFYRHLGDAGVRVGIVDLPADRPDPHINGVQVVDWATEFRYWHYATVPRSFAWQLRWRVGRNPMTYHWNSGDSPAAHAELCDKLRRSIEQKTRVGQDLLRRRDLDFVALVFGEPHKAGHWLWKYQDQSHVDYDVRDTGLRNGLLDTYRWVDTAVGKLLAGLSADDNLIVFSDHGMQAAHRGNHLIDLILERFGLLVFEPHAAADSSDFAARAASAPRRRLTSARAAVKRALPRRLVRGLERNADSFPGVDWQRTRAFSLPTDRNSYIRLNLQGREPRGIVPAQAYDAELRAIEQALLALINPKTGRAAVDETFRVRERFPGEHQDDLPDLAVRWSAEAPIDEVVSPSLGRISRSARELRSGNHREEGFLLARGPAFKSGASLQHGDVLQIAPTLLCLHGVPLPDQHEMPPLSDILR